MLQVSSTAIEFFACVLVGMFSRAEAKLCESLKKMMGISSILRRESCDLLLLTHRRQARHIAILSTQRRLTVRRMINSNSIYGTRERISLRSDGTGTLDQLFHYNTVLGTYRRPSHQKPFPSRVPSFFLRIKKIPAADRFVEGMNFLPTTKEKRKKGGSI